MSNPSATPEDEYDLRQCAEWLNRCRIIPDDHPTLMPDGCGLQLVQTLMDGVKICHLLNILTNGEVDPRKMKDFSPQTQQSPFLCCQNIRLFVKLCEDEFGVDKKYLIEPSDLYHAKNFGKVIELLSKLSRSPRAQLSGIPYVINSTILCQFIVDFLRKMATCKPPMNTTTISKISQHRCRISHVLINFWS